MTSKITAAGADADRQAVPDVLARVYQAWEVGDAEAFVTDYSEDASVIQPGVYEKDREEIRRLAHRLLPAPAGAQPVPSAQSRAGLAGRRRG